MKFFIQTLQGRFLTYKIFEILDRVNNIKKYLTIIVMSVYISDDKNIMLICVIFYNVDIMILFYITLYQLILCH